MKCTQCNNTLTGNQKKYCCSNCKAKGHRIEVNANNNSYHSQSLRGWSRKLKFIEMLGGGCSVCGYDKNISALEFNHIDPKTKSFNLDTRKLSNTRESTLLLEIAKCNLLCANCHREHHYVEMTKTNVATMKALSQKISIATVTQLVE